MSQEQQDGVCYVLAGLHVGNINFEGEDNASITAGSRPSLEKAIQVLGTLGLEKCFVSRTMTTRGETIMCADSGSGRACISPTRVRAARPLIPPPPASV